MKTALTRLMEDITSADPYLSMEERNIEARKSLLRIMADLSSYMLWCHFFAITRSLLIDEVISLQSASNPERMEVSKMEVISV